jgi:hypothetical protein
METPGTNESTPSSGSAPNSIRDYAKLPAILAAYHGGKEHPGHGAAAAIQELAARVSEEAERGASGQADDFDGIQLSGRYGDEDRAVVVSLARESNIPPAALSEMIADFAKHDRPGYGRLNASQARAAFHEMWGDSAEGNLTTIREWLAERPGLNRYLARSPLGNSPAVGVALLGHIARSNVSQGQIEAAMQDKAYTDTADPRHDAAVKAVTKMFQARYGNKPA